jgi:thiol-disulfide isomerase/thioredoxin
MFARIALAALALAAVPSTLVAQVPKEAGAKVTLAPGMPAPSLSVAKWVKGSPVASFEKGKLYVVEFWATWCGPCIRSMPHLSELQRDLGAKGLTIVGVTTEDKDNSLAKVEKMVADKGDGLAYAVAWDDGQKTKAAWRDASGGGGIPKSFVVDGEGRIAYVGHPMFLDYPLGRLLAGTWDIEKGNAEVKALEAKLQGVRAKEKSDPRAAYADLKAVYDAAPGIATFYGTTLFSLSMANGDHQTGYALAGELVDAAIAAKDPQTLNLVSWAIVDPQGKVEKRDLELALRAAEAAVELTEEKDGAVLDTLARVHAWKGDYAKALALQTKALEVAEPQYVEEIRAALEEYKAKASQ